MKAIVMEIDKKYAVVLKDNGQFERVPNNGYTVGDEFSINDRSIAVSLSMIGRIAAVFILLTGLFFFSYTYSTPYSYISIDINPGAELIVNIYDRVIDIKGTNEDGMNFVKKEGYLHKKSAKSAARFVKEASDAGFLKDDEENVVFVTVSSKGNYEKIIEHVDKEISETITDIEKDAGVFVVDVTTEERERAAQENISPGKMVLLDKLYDDIEYEEYSEVSVKDIMKEVIENRKAEQEQRKRESGNNEDKDYVSNEDEQSVKDIMKGVIEDRKAEQEQRKSESGNIRTVPDKDKHEVQNTMKEIIESRKAEQEQRKNGLDSSEEDDISKPADDKHEVQNTMKEVIEDRKAEQEQGKNGPDSSEEDDISKPADDKHEVKNTMKEVIEDRKAEQEQRKNGPDSSEEDDITKPVEDKHEVKNTMKEVIEDRKAEQEQRINESDNSEENIISEPDEDEDEVQNTMKETIEDGKVDQEHGNNDSDNEMKENSSESNNGNTDRSQSDSSGNGGGKGR